MNVMKIRDEHYAEHQKLIDSTNVKMEQHVRELISCDFIAFLRRDQ